MYVWLDPEERYLFLVLDLLNYAFHVIFVGTFPVYIPVDLIFSVPQRPKAHTRSFGTEFTEDL